MMKHLIGSHTLAGLFALCLIGCNSGRQSAHDHDHDHTHEHDDGSHAQSAQPATGSPAKAVALLGATQGNNAAGTVTFTREAEGIRVVAEVTGLSPNGKHGFHIHEHGDCSAPDASSAGGHFNPTGKPHAGPHDDERHVGDLGNLQADENGRARLEWVDPHLSFSGETSIIGRSVIVHAGPDDLTSQPAGDAGPRIACGIIQTE